jgi:hypothetical protein
MAKKFDTNPLDPEFPERAKAASANYGPPPKTPYSTSEFPTSAPASVTEEETRRFTDSDFQAYSYATAQPVVPYQAPDFADMNRASERKVAKTGVSEKWLIGLPYIPFYIGLVAGLIGASAAEGLSYATSRYVFDIEWSLAPQLNLTGVALTILLVTIVGALSTLDVLTQKPLGILRTQ